jgi:glycogen debranching enzyme
MFADIYTPEEAEAVVRIHFHNTETFRAPYGIRTVSKQEPSYRPDGFWRGPIWMSVNWFIYRGLVRYGFKKEAAWIRDSSVQLLQTAGFREYFNPETGEGYGADTFTWGTLVLDMIDA